MTNLTWSGTPDCDCSNPLPVKICSGSITTNVPAQFWVLCDPVTGDRVIVVLTFDALGNPVFPAVAYNLDGTPYVGLISALVSCGSEQYDITEGEPWCDAGVTIIPYTIFDVSVTPPTVVSVVWLNLAGTVVIPSGAQTPGACSAATAAPLLDSYDLILPAGAFVTQAFPTNGKTLLVENHTAGTVRIDPTFSGAVAGNNSAFVGADGSINLTYESVLFTSITITDLGGGGGEILVTLTSE